MNAEKPKKVVEEYDSSEEEVEVNYTKSSYIAMKQKKAWKPVFCVLFGGSFYYYKNKNDPEPKGRIDLEGLTVVSPARNEKRKNSFALQKGEELLFVGSCSGVQELEQWTKALQDSLDKEKTEAPTAGKKKMKKAGLYRRAKNNISSISATSVIGKKVMKSIVNEETTSVLAALKRIVKAESGAAKKAEDLEKNILKITVKVYMLIEARELNADEFLSADKPVREAFELLVRIYNGRDRVKPEKIAEALKKVEALLKKAEEIICQLLSLHLSSKNMLRVSNIFSCLGEVKFLETVLSLRDPSLEADLEKLVSSMEVYTQVQYH